MNENHHFLTFLQILKNFDKGKCWEKGIPLCKELADFYETKRFDYNRLSDILTLQAQFTQKILIEIRPDPEYFRVGFYGMDFPLFVRVSWKAIVATDNWPNGPASRGTRNVLKNMKN